MTSSEGGRPAVRFTLRLLGEPRWVGLAVLVAAIVPLFLLLAQWQWDRMGQRQERNALISERMAVAPMTLAAAQRAAADSPGALTWRVLDVLGTYDQAAEVLVRKQALDGQPGYLVVTPLLVAGSGIGPAADEGSPSVGGNQGDARSLPIVRGWLPATAVDRGPATTSVAAPAGSVTVTGRLRTLTEGAPRPADLPPGQVNDIPVPPDPALPGYYLELIWSPAPTAPGTPTAHALTPLPPPTLGAGPHLFYAVQWVVFAAIAVGGFIVLLQREVRDRLAMVVPAHRDQPGSPIQPVSERARAGSR